MNEQWSGDFSIGSSCLVGFVPPGHGIETEPPLAKGMKGPA